MTQQPPIDPDDRFPGFVLSPDDGIERDIDALPDFVAKDNEGWRKVADIRDGMRRFVQAVASTLERL